MEFKRSCFVLTIYDANTFSMKALEDPNTKTAILSLVKNKPKKVVYCIEEEGFDGYVTDLTKKDKPIYPAHQTWDGWYEIMNSYYLGFGCNIELRSVPFNSREDAELYVKSLENYCDNEGFVF